MSLDYAIELAAKGHAGQKDKAGQPYILHVLRVMLAMNTDEERIVAALHDLVEDTHFSLSQLRQLGFSPEIVSAVDILTRQEGQSYEGYIARISRHALATRVKLADLQDNMNLARLPHPTDRDFDRHERYVKAWCLLRVATMAATTPNSVPRDVEPLDVPGGEKA